jgi:tetratricopeptide (TPR) repeat protein
MNPQDTSEANITHIIHTAEELIECGRIIESISYLEKALHTFPEELHIALLLGEAYLCNGEPEKAIKPLKWALKRKEETFEEMEHELDWELYYLLGSSYARSSKFKKALEYLELANNINPNSSEILRNIGWVMCCQNRTLCGRSILRRSIQIDPENALAYCDLGASYMFEGNYSEANTWIMKAKQLDPLDMNILETADQLQHLINLNKLFPKRKPRRLKTKKLNTKPTPQNQ